MQQVGGGGELVVIIFRKTNSIKRIYNRTKGLVNETKMTTLAVGNLGGTFSGIFLFYPIFSVREEVLILC